MNPTHCAKCGAAFLQWALVDSTLVPYEPHPNGNLLLEQTPGGPARLFRPPRSQFAFGLAKFRREAATEPRFVSHFSVCNPIPNQEQSNVR